MEEKNQTTSAFLPACLPCQSSLKQDLPGRSSRRAVEQANRANRQTDDRPAASPLCRPSSDRESPRSPACSHLISYSSFLFPTLSASSYSYSRAERVRKFTLTCIRLFYCISSKPICQSPSPLRSTETCSPIASRPTERVSCQRFLECREGIPHMKKL